MRQVSTAIGTLLPIRRLFPWWKVIYPFQSIVQFQSWALIVVIITGLFLLAVGMLGGRSIAPETVLVFAAAGAFPSVESVLPGQMDIASEHPRVALVALDNALLRIGYIASSETLPSKIYRQNLPRLLRWIEGELKVTFLPSGASVSGAIGAIYLLRENLIKNHSNTIG